MPAPVAAEGWTQSTPDGGIILASDRILKVGPAMFRAGPYPRQWGATSWASDSRTVSPRRRAGTVVPIPILYRYSRSVIRADAIAMIRIIRIRTAHCGCVSKLVDKIP
jgi:hypothetical protein